MIAYESKDPNELKWNDTTKCTQRMMVNKQDGNTCGGEMIEVGGINKHYQYLDKGGIVCEAEVKLYQCEVCKTIKLV